jgi:hypothetical protein
VPGVHAAAHTLPGLPTCLPSENDRQIGGNAAPFSDRARHRLPLISTTLAPASLPLRTPCHRFLCVNPWTRVNEKSANVTLVCGDEEPLTVITTDPATSAIFIFAAFLYQAVYQVSKTTLFTLVCLEACAKAIALHPRKNMGVETLEANWGFGGNITLVWSVIASHVTTSSAYTFFPVS